MSSVESTAPRDRVHFPVLILNLIKGQALEGEAVKKENFFFLFPPQDQKNAFIKYLSIWESLSLSHVI